MVTKISIGKSLYGALAYNGEKINEAKGRLLATNRIYNDGTGMVNIGKAMEELLDFDRTIGDVLEWAAADGHTLVVVTADHNTGALTLQDGNLEEGRIGVAFGSESHNGIAVPFYAWGPGSDAFTGIRENDEWGRLIASFVK